MKWIILLILLVPTLQAEEKQLTIVKEGDMVEYDGFLCNKEQMKHFRQINEEKKLCDQKTIKLEQLGLLQAANGEWYKENYYQIKKDYEWREVKSSWEKTFYFFGGVFLTGAISYGTIKYIK